jgi:hypothetical protein
LNYGAPIFQRKDPWLMRRLLVALTTLGLTLAYPAAALADIVRSSWS